MFPTNVALVPYEPDSAVPLDDLTHVAAALEVQMLRDFGPIWGVSGAVAAFASLDAMPPEYLPIVVIEKDIPVQTHGFHFTLAGVPFALVRHDDGWPLAASHELLEMVLDPSGGLMRPGRSLERDEAWVDYLVEVCDPCEHSSYDIHGITVSDFVTPDYYSAAPAEGSRYSFLRTIEEPLQVLGQGYLTWRTRLPDNQLYQAFGGPDESADGDDGNPATTDTGTEEPDPTKPYTPLSINEVPHTSSTITRASVNLSRVRHGARHASSGAPYYRPGGPAGFGDALRKDIGEFLDYVEKWQSTRPPTIDTIIKVIEELAPGGKLDAGDRADLHDKIKRTHGFADATPDSPADRHNKKPPADYARVVAYLEAQKKVSGIFGPDLMDPGMGLWMSMHIL